MFGLFRRNDDLAREVLVEVAYLTKLYGDSAGQVALEKAQRPRLAKLRRRVLRDAARHLADAEGRKRSPTDVSDSAASLATINGMDDDAPFRLSPQQDGWLRAEPDMTTPSFAAGDGVQSRITRYQDEWSPLEPQRRAAPVVEIYDASQSAASESLDSPGEVEFEPASILAREQGQDAGQSEVSWSAAPRTECAEPPAPVRRPKRVVLSRKTTFGIELEIDGLVVMFDQRADAKVVSALVYALRDS